MKDRVFGGDSPKATCWIGEVGGPGDLRKLAVNGDLTRMTGLVEDVEGASSPVLILRGRDGGDLASVVRRSRSSTWCPFSSLCVALPIACA